MACKEAIKASRVISTSAAWAGELWTVDRANEGWMKGSDLRKWMLGLLVVSTHPKNISQIGNLPQIGVKIKHNLKPLPSWKFRPIFPFGIGHTSRACAVSFREGNEFFSY